MANIFKHEFSRGLRPETRINYVDWADNYFYLPRESSAEYGRFRSSRTPFIREILQELSPSSPTEIVVLIKPTQLAGTTVGLIFLCAMMDVSPGPALFIGVTDYKTRVFSKKKLQKAIESTAKLNSKVKAIGKRDGGNTLMLKEYPGGSLMLTGSNSGASYRSESIKYLVLDDFDGFEGDIEGEGSPEELADRRTGSFPNRKIYINSTTTTKGASNIETAFENTSQGYYNVPCPHCGHYQYLQWGGPDENYGIKFTRDEHGIVDEAWYQCEKCNERIDESNKQWMIERGKYVHKFPKRKARGFRYNAYVTPIGWVNSWVYIAQKFIEANIELKRGNPSKMKTWMNSFEAVAWEEKGDRPKWKALFDRREDYMPMTMDNKAVLLTAGVDTQDNRLEFVVRAWAGFEESWLVYNGVLYGDPAEGEVFLRLDNVLNYPYVREDGTTMMIMCLAIDAMGHRTQSVYNYARKRKPRVIAIQGATKNTTPVLKPIPTKVDCTYQGKLVKKGVELWTVGSHMGKQTIYSRLGIKSGPGAYHWHAETQEEYFKQLTSEKLVRKKNKKGRYVNEWVKAYERNEALDCEVYAYAAAIRCGVVALHERENVVKTIPQAAKMHAAKSIENIRTNIQNRTANFSRPSWLER